MCGIAGKISPNGVTEAELADMLAAISHRGPDDEGCYLNPGVGLGSRRLSVIDIPTGKQPISNEDGTIWLAFNGEIYNYRALRQQLIGRGHQFRSQGDSETIIHLYEEMREKCVERLRGMFAFALWDSNRQLLLLTRDHFGQKPLFYAQVGDDFLFASEVKGILAANGAGRELNWDSLHHYLSLRFIPPPETMLGGIKKLPAAHTLVYHDGKIQLNRYWQISYNHKLNQPDERILDELKVKLSDSIEAHLVSDVPVGAFLSGGMDSSMIVAVMGQKLRRSFKTFGVGVAEADFNELPFARMVAEQCGTDHVELTVDSDIIKCLPQIIYHLDEPSDPIAACQYQAAALAARHVKVALGGDGGDELFAGFDRYLGLHYINYYAKLPSAVRRNGIAPILKRLPDDFSYKNLTQKMRWINTIANAGTDGLRYAEATCFFRFSHTQKRALFHDQLWAKIGQFDSRHIIADQFDRAPAGTLLDKMLYADMMTRLPEHSLMLTDRMTMAHGLEARSPFLDRELAEFVATMPNHLKIHRRQLKTSLRSIAHEYLPAEIVNREKHGFMFPIAYWFRGRLRSFLTNFLPETYFVREAVFNKRYIAQLIDEHGVGQADHHVRLWMLLNLGIWHALYLERQSVSDVTKWVSSYLRD